MPTATDTPVLIARQPIVDGRRTVFGYELFDRSHAADDHSAASDVTLVFNALAHTGSEVLVGQFTIFVNSTHNSLAGGHLDLVQPDRLVLEISPIEGDDAIDIEGRSHALAALRKRGFRLAFNQTVLKSAYAPWLALADFIKLDLSAIDPMQLPQMLQAAKARTSARLIAEKTETAAQYEQLSGYGVDLFQGFWFAKPDLIRTRLLAPAQANVVHLINLVRSQASTDAIEEVLKKDAMLGFNLMRLINSSGFGLAREITSFRQAVMLLGLKRLFRWAALLLTASRAGGAPPVVGSTAVVRGRLMELLAAESMGPEECDSAFVVGVFSLLDAMLGIPMDRAVELLSLPRPIVDALLHGTGPFGELLALARSCEAGDDPNFRRAAASLHLSDRQINLAHLDALAWADALVE
ncbi:EAL and HDOD domain-containing protein [Pseudorhodoferax sp. Leaf267]|uniref:EAL and HDOD domain-containing protein n=1 Tax=Pseudorhodoferax sp. Leaf267 TaxID=1736316 RepID=UPI0006F2FF7B|nr:HDOD domain-containing protein [Pseudorhodoferax sp. Leaf267]KQP22594.1 diguanylate phosphodiesterase [Pseudorhodoferax sp. Leaf267]